MGRGNTLMGYLYHRTVKRKSTPGDDGEVSSETLGLVSKRGVVGRDRPLPSCGDIWLALECRNEPP